MVDYLPVNKESLGKVSKFEVRSPSDVVNTSDSIKMLNTSDSIKMLIDKSKFSDHAILITELNLSETPEHTCVHYEPNINNTEMECEDLNSKKIYNFRNIPSSFMNNDLWKRIVTNMIDKHLNRIENQSELDLVYTKLQEFIAKEMKAHL